MKPGGIPLLYLTKMGYSKNINLDGISGITVHNADCEDAVDKHVIDLHRSVKSVSVKVVGIDVKQFNPKSYTSLCSLIVHLDCLNEFPHSLYKFLKDADVCFVSRTELSFPWTAPYSCIEFDGDIVKLGDLAARVLMKPGLKTKSVAEIAGEVGVSYVSPSNNASKSLIKIDSEHPRVLSTEQVKVAISDACACYRIGYKLLSTL